jgi:hypothetical protein
MRSSTTNTCPVVSKKKEKKRARVGQFIYVRTSGFVYILLDLNIYINIIHGDTYDFPTDGWMRARVVSRWDSLGWMDGKNASGKRDGPDRATFRKTSYF